MSNIKYLNIILFMSAEFPPRKEGFYLIFLPQIIFFYHTEIRTSKLLVCLNTNEKFYLTN